MSTFCRGTDKNQFCKLFGSKNLFYPVVSEYTKCQIQMTMANSRHKVMEIALLTLFSQASWKVMFSLIFVTSLKTFRIAEPCYILSFYKPGICWNNFSVRQTLPTNFSDNCDLENSLIFRFIKAWESLSSISRLELGGCQVSEKQQFIVYHLCIFESTVTGAYMQQ